MNVTPFWKQKSLSELSMTSGSLCDGCGKCLHKLEDEDTDEISYQRRVRFTRYWNMPCTNYVERTFRVPDCVELTAKNLTSLKWLPPTCAHRVIHEGKGSSPAVPLVSGDPDTVHRANVSVKNRAIPEKQAGGLEDHIATWPKETSGGDAP